MRQESAKHVVVVLALNKVVAFDFSITGQVLGRAELAHHYQVRHAGLTAGSVSTHTGFEVVVSEGIEVVEKADTIIVPGYTFDAVPDPPALEALREAYVRGARIASICTGAFALAAAGLLDGRRATTHWHHAALLQARYPQVQVDSGPIYLQSDESLYTSAGVSAGVDLCLHLLEHDLGPEVALETARAMVVPRHRTGDQSQFIPLPPDPHHGSAVAEAAEWASANPALKIQVSDLARRVRVSTRTLHRLWLDSTGLPPHQWLLRTRVDHAARLLEHPKFSVEAIASAAGLGSAASLRLHFKRLKGVSPSAYRAAFHDSPRTKK